MVLVWRLSISKESIMSKNKGLAKNFNFDVRDMSRRQILGAGILSVPGWAAVMTAAAFLGEQAPEALYALAKKIDPKVSDLPPDMQSDRPLFHVKNLSIMEIFGTACAFGAIMHMALLWASGKEEEQNIENHPEPKI